jgi:hypothetical protein
MKSNSIRARAFGLLVSGLVMAAAETPGSTQATARPAVRPNIVHIVADDLGWKDVGFNGCADIKYWPKQRGFDYQYGAMIGELDYYTHSDAGVLDWFRNNQPVREEGYTTQLLGDDAVRYLNALGKESAKPLALIYVTRVGLAHGKPLMASADGNGPAMVGDHGPAITDEGFGETEAEPDRH